MEPFVGEIRLFSFNYAPVNWLACNGQNLVAQQYMALYSLLGVTYGGVAGTNFNLPNLNGRILTGTGTSPVTPNTTYVLGQTGGSETVQLTSAQIPAHNHTINVNVSYDQNNPNTNFFGNPNVKTAGSTVAANFGTALTYAPYTGPTGMIPMNPASITGSGASAPHENRMPYLPLLYCICIYGNYPPRD